MFFPNQVKQEVASNLGEECLVETISKPITEPSRDELKRKRQSPVRTNWLATIELQQCSGWGHTVLHIELCIASDVLKMH